MTSGVYEIVNLLTGKRYIGSAADIPFRWRSHKYLLEKGAHHSTHLQRSWIKHGAPQFRFTALLICSKDNLLFYEQRALDILKPEYNLCPKAGSPRGRKTSDETKAKLVAAGIGRIFTPERCANIAKALRGRKHTAETKAKLAVINTGRKQSAATILKRAKALRGNRNAVGSGGTKTTRWPSEQMAFLRENYPMRGVKWCCDHLRKSPSAVKTMAGRNGIRFDQGSEFFKEWQRRAALTRARQVLLSRA